MTYDATVIIPWRECPSRRPGFDWVLRYYRHRFDKVIVSEQSDGKFNKSAAINSAIKHCNPKPEDVFVIADADCFIADWAMEAGISKAKVSNKLVRPHKRYLRTSKEQAEFILQQDPTKKIFFHWFHKKFNRFKAKGGVWIIRFEVFDRTGWMDEGYVGWGGEDSDFIARCGSVVMNGPLYHIWHEPAPDKSFSSPGCKRFHEKFRRRKKRR
ncbi:MAG: hypothetical protein CMK32_10065 [Porticoccaceae bacterium]|nr:hypothetical protein [Porticoccaceae bacterium]